MFTYSSISCEIQTSCVFTANVQESALRSRHITIVKKGWLSKGPDSNQDASIVSFSRVSVSCFMTAGDVTDDDVITLHLHVSFMSSS